MFLPLLPPPLPQQGGPRLSLPSPTIECRSRMWFRSLGSTCWSSRKSIFTRTVTLYQELVMVLSAAARGQTSYRPGTQWGHQWPWGEKADRRPGGRRLALLHLFCYSRGAAAWPV